MKKSITCAFLFIISGFGHFLYAQETVAVRGVVINSNGEAIAGASVIVKGTTTGTSTDDSGAFQLNAPHNATLVISAINYTTHEEVISPSPMTIVLQSGTTDLTEVIVIGYGTQQVTKVSGAISTVRSDDIEKLRPVRIEDALQGSVSGVTVIQNGSPGSKPTVLVRGIPSFSGTDPAVIIDGVPQTLDDLNALSYDDIASMTVLKDAAATAIYGIKGGNGVILVTTKSGRKNQKTQFNFRANYGIQSLVRQIPVLNAQEYAAIVNEGSVAAGGALVFTDLSKVGLGTNWQKEIFHDAPLQDYNISASGGTERMTYFLSGGYMGQDGIVGGGSKSSFNRLTATSNLSFDLTGRLKLRLNTNYARIQSKGILENSFNSIIGSALNFDPTVSKYNEDTAVQSVYGYSNLLLSEIFNPLTKLMNTYNTSSGDKLYGKAELQYSVLKNLSLTTRFGYVLWNQTGKTFTPLVFYGPLNVENTLDAKGNRIEGKHNSVSENKNMNASFTSETFANYTFKLGDDHNFETVAGIGFSKSKGDGISASRQDVPFNSWTFADITSATGTNSATNVSAFTAGNSQFFRKNASYFARANYDYNGRYLASLTYRRDGSYAFGPENKFADFLSGSAGWIVSREEFFYSNLIDYLKIRGSYGTVGNENVSPQFVSIVTGGPSYGATANSNGYTFGNIFVPGSTVGSYRNDALAWEKQEQLNIGFDIYLADNKLSLSADYYEKKVTGLLFTPSVSLYLGTAAIPTANIGSTKSSGIDATIGYNDKFSSKFSINTSLTFTTQKNLVTATNDDGTAIINGGSYFNGQSQTVTRFQKGYTPGYFYGFKTDGLFQTTEDVGKTDAQPNAQPGDIRFVDVNGDGVINNDDKTKIGDPFPDFTMGWNLSVTYGGFNFSMFTYASVGNDVFRAYERNANYSNKFRDVLGRWTGPESTNDARFPRYSFTDANNNARASDRYVEDGSFVKVKNIQVSYSLPANIYRNVFDNITVLLQVRNALTLTKYSGYDPEIPGGILETGVDRGNYPIPRIYSAGIQIKF